MACRLAGEFSAAARHLENHVGRDCLALPPCLNPNGIIVQKNDWQELEIEALRNGEPMVPVHDEPIVSMNGDRPCPPTGLDDLLFEFGHSVTVDFFGWSELPRVEKLVLDNARFHSRLADVTTRENASQIVYERELTPF
ncbi:hypothetical protein [Rhizobium sp. BR 362]|uniref:hypothetical protein n=1 Tax=Rhizobium sp. BR 362 TaxID=3040670 RepID=UPI003FA7499E